MTAYGVEVASIRVAYTRISVIAVSATAGIASAHGLASGSAWMGCERRRDRIRFPNVELSTTASVVAEAGVLVVCCRCPSFDIGLAVDELEVTRTLRVAVARAVLSTSLVRGVLCHATVGIHGDKVECGIEAAWNVGQINIKSELLAKGLEHLVVGAVRHQVRARANVGTISILRYKLQIQGVAAGGDAISAGVVSSINSTLRSAGGVSRADGCVPCVACSSASAFHTLAVYVS